MTTKSASISMTPKALDKGDTVALVSPSMRANEIFVDAMQRARKYLEGHGFKVVVIFDPETRSDFEQQTVQRCEEVHAAFRDPMIKAVICTLGGSHANELLPHLDYALIKANPKIFCGYSDITVLHWAIYTQTGLRTFYGPTAISPLGGYPEPLSFTSQDFLRALTEPGRRPLGPVPVSAEYTPNLEPFFLGEPSLQEAPAMKANLGWRWLRPGSARGRIFGGCLHSIMHLRGTTFWPDLRDRVLFLETALADTDPRKGVSLESLRAELADLRIINVFREISGLIIGRPYGYEDKARSKEYDAIVLQQTRGYSFPILSDVDIGHTMPMLTIPLDALTELDSSLNKFDILEPSVS